MLMSSPLSHVIFIVTDALSGTSQKFQRLGLQLP